MTRSRISLIYLIAVCLLVAAVFDLSGVEVLNRLSVLCLIMAGLTAIVAILFDVIDKNSRDTTSDDLNDIAQAMEDEHDRNRK